MQSALARTAAEEVAFLCTVCLYIFGVSYDKDFFIPSLSAFASRLLSGHGQHLPERGSWRTSTPLEGAKTQGIDFGKPLGRQSSFINTMVGTYEKCMEEKSTSKKNMVTFNSSVEEFSASSLAIGGSVGNEKKGKAADLAWPESPVKGTSDDIYCDELFSPHMQLVGDVSPRMQQRGGDRIG